ncbi:MAG: glycoside hydrolase family 57 [Micavibrio sp.]|nr:glycoside hydrolase family 57 [Micavibrio sp.]
MTANYVCIHSHFYQPPRENPWLDAIDYQESAQPFHDWNARIDFECYHPNSRARILDDEGWVTRLTNNYARISFNFGPTLLSWLEKYDQATYQAILDGDKQSQQRYGGHGSAIAQAYNHIIMPLANRRDKETQIKWGLRDFESRFEREAEAMWLPETAVDTETLEILADHGMKYVILAPNQARPEQGNLDTREPYAIELPGNKSIAAFFYDGGLSQAVAFENLLHNGEHFARRLLSGFDNRSQGQLLHIATDGESYGHHHRHGDMALAYALDFIEKSDAAKLTNYGQYLEISPPQGTMRIHENSSWSCAHGIERWRSDCGCNSGMQRGWTQQWRAPLRQAIDYLRDEIEKPFLALADSFTDDPWAMRNDYISLILQGREKAQAEFFKKWVKQGTETSPITIIKAQELQRNLLLAYTSCAWFFDEISGTESVQVLQYAARVIELAEDILDLHLEEGFESILEQAPSNIDAFQNGQNVYTQLALPARIDFLKLAAHIAATNLLRDKIQDGHLHAFDYHWHDISRSYFGKAQMMSAHISALSNVTGENHQIEFVIIHLGDQNISVGALPYSGAASYAEMTKEFQDAFAKGETMQALRLLDKYFDGNLYSLNDLLRDQKKEIIDVVFSQTLESVEDQFDLIYDQHYPVMRYLSSLHIALPPVFSHIARFVQSSMIEAELREEPVDCEALKNHIREAALWGVEIDAARVEAQYLQALRRLSKRFYKDGTDMDALRSFTDLLEMRLLLPFHIDLGDIQNDYALWVFQQRHHPAPELQTLIERSASLLQIRMREQPL